MTEGERRRRRDDVSRRAPRSVVEVLELPVGWPGFSSSSSSSESKVRSMNDLLDG